MRGRLQVAVRPSFVNMSAPMNVSPPSRNADQFVVRLPEALRETIKARAASNNRSMNAESVAILCTAIGANLNLSAASVETLLKAVADRMGSKVEINTLTPLTTSGLEQDQPEGKVKLPRQSL